MVIKEFPLVARCKVTFYTRNRTSTKNVFLGSGSVLISHYRRESGCILHSSFFLRNFAKNLQTLDNTYVNNAADSSIIKCDWDYLSISVTWLSVTQSKNDVPWLWYCWQEVRLSSIFLSAFVLCKHYERVVSKYLYSRLAALSNIDFICHLIRAQYSRKLQLNSLKSFK